MQQYAPAICLTNSVTAIREDITLFKYLCLSMVTAMVFLFSIKSRLKQDIRDPNASELVHMLFGPLETVAEASRSADDNKLNLASQVVSPLLTVAAVDLLNNCLTSKQMELWRSLGSAWMTPRYIIIK